MKLLILGRDGVINHCTESGAAAHDWQPIRGSVAAIARASQAGLRCVVFANGSRDRGRGFDIEALNQLHARLLAAVDEHGGRIEAIFYCPHHPDTACTCFDADAGLLAQITERTRVPVSVDTVTVVGDCRADIEAAQRIGARPVLVKTGLGKAALKGHAELPGTLVVADLAHAVDLLVAAAT